MRKIIYVLTAFLLITSSCKKKYVVNFSGYVYSKSNYPMKSIVVNIQYSHGGKSQGGMLKTTTDQNGFFKFNNELGRDERPKEIHVFGTDSGSYHGDFPENTLNMDIVLK